MALDDDGAGAAQQEARVTRLESENRELRALVRRLQEHMEWLEDSLDAHLARVEHEREGGETYSLQEVQQQLGL